MSGTRRGNQDPSQATSGNFHIDRCKKITRRGECPSAITPPPSGSSPPLTELSGAVEKTRTSTGFRPQRPQRCASTSPATTALEVTRPPGGGLPGRGRPLAKGQGGCKRACHSPVLFVIAAAGAPASARENGSISRASSRFRRSAPIAAHRSPLRSPPPFHPAPAR